MKFNFALILLATILSLVIRYWYKSYLTKIPTHYWEENFSSFIDYIDRNDPLKYITVLFFGLIILGSLVIGIGRILFTL